MVRAERHWCLPPSVPKWWEDRGGRQRPGLLGEMVPVEELHGERGNVKTGDFLQDARDLLFWRSEQEPAAA